MKHLEEQFNTQITEYTICAKRHKDDEFYHTWYIGTDLKEDEALVAEKLDTFLKEANKNYKVARSKALEGVKVNIIPAAIFHSWSERNKKKGGQVKMERVMGSEKFTAWEAFVKDELKA